MNKLFTFGYGNQREAEILLKLPGLIMDVRYAPYSRVTQWNKTSLQILLGSRYYHNGFLGNVNYKGGPIELKDARRGLDILRERLENSPVTLLCCCSNVRICHRLSVAELAMAEFGAQAQHLTLRSLVPDAPPEPDQLTLF